MCTISSSIPIQNNRTSISSRAPPSWIFIRHGSSRHIFWGQTNYINHTSQFIKYVVHITVCVVFFFYRGLIFFSFRGFLVLCVPLVFSSIALPPNGQDSLSRVTKLPTTICRVLGKKHQTLCYNLCHKAS